MLNKHLPDLLKKQMTRKEFINLCAVFVVSMFGIVGALETLVSRAAGPEASEEADKGTLANGAQLKTDPNSSDGEAVVFGQATTTTGNYQPTINGLTGTWTLAFDDEFNGVNSDGTGLDTKKWAYGNGGAPMNNVSNLPASNVAVSGGNLILTLSDENTGAMITTCDSSGNP